MGKEVVFEVNYNGGSLENKYVGTFKCKLRLTQREKLENDKFYRFFLGENTKDMADADKERAFALADFRTYITDGPPWFKFSDFGLDLEEDGLVVEIWKQMNKKRNECLEEEKKKVFEDAKTIHQAVQGNQILKNES